MQDWNLPLNPDQLFTLILFTPLLAALLNALFLRTRGWAAAGVSVSAAFISMVAAFAILLNLDAEGGAQAYASSMTWLELGDLTISMGYAYTPMTATMLFVVTFVGFLIHVFSVGYMDDDASKGRFFAGLSIFMFSMLGIVLADNLMMIFVFWELVGFSSYMLIAHYWHTDEAREACKKAFIMNRVGDFGMLLGIIWAFWHYGTVNIAELSLLAQANPEMLHGGIALLLICGFIGKSAQFPLHTWLPDAMAGPTPVSALIHAATMVAAGIYFICRIFFILDPLTLDIVLWLGVAMAVYAGICAFAQTDIKKILAYSTLSQLGYMAAAVGLGFPGLALFHTATHAFFKALLFLGSGSVIHACHHEQDIFKMGGLMRRMPLTTLTFAIGTIALCGFTFTSGYFSKDAIIEAAYLENDTAFALLLLGAFLTSAYMGRLFLIAFMGKAKSNHAEHAHESSVWMVAPLLILAALSLVGGFDKLWLPYMAQTMHANLEAVHHGVHEAHADNLFLILGVATWLTGFAGAFFFYRPGAKDDALERKCPATYSFLKQKLWFDEIYNWYTKNIQQRAAEVLNAVDAILIGLVGTRVSAGIVGWVGLAARSLHVGSVHAYVFWFLFGVLIFWGLAQGVF